MNWGRAIRLVGKGTAIGVAAWALGLAVFAAALPDAVDDAERHTDAIVVLTGGSERLVTGIELLRDGRADKLLVSGVNQSVAMGDLLAVLPDMSPRLVDRITLGYAADDTRGNATETAAWARDNAVSSLRLVTSSYHMPRALLEFRKLMPSVSVVPHPVFPAHVKQGEWWLWPGTAALITGEYTKYLLASLRPAK